MKTYIENKGITKTIITNNGEREENIIKWNADYDGNYADIKLNVSNNCKKNKVHLRLNNNDLSNILGIHSIEMPIEERLERDFLSVNTYKPKILYKPKGYLYRTHIPKMYHNKRYMEPTYKLNEMNISPINIDERISPELISSIPNLTPESLIMSKSIPLNKFKKTKKIKHIKNLNRKKIEYKTPSPKTLRIHLSSNKKNKTKKNTLSNFF